MTHLSEAHLTGIEKRGISRETATRMGLYSGRRLRDGSVVADPDGDILCFPYVEHGKEINTKYRWRQDGAKRFSQRPDSPKTFFNADVLLDEAMMRSLEAGVEALVITEGEFDAMSAIEAGFEAAVSVPDGAPPARDKAGVLIQVPDGTADINPEDDTKYAYIARHMDRLMRVKAFIIATDADEPGRRLAKEIVRRVGAARCYWVEYPSDQRVPDEDGVLRAPKDLNEVLIHFGVKVVQDILENAKPWPVKGLYRLSDYPEQEEPRTYEIGLSKQLDEHFRLYPGAFIVFTGVSTLR